MATLTPPEWAGIDWNWVEDVTPGTTGYWCNVRVIIGGVVRAKSPFAFPGVDGSFSQQLGKRKRDIVWLLDIVAKTESDLNTILGLIEDAGESSYDMTAQGGTYLNVELVDGPTPVGPWELLIEPTIQAEPMLLQRFELRFEERVP